MDCSSSHNQERQSLDLIPGFSPVPCEFGLPVRMPAVVSFRRSRGHMSSGKGKIRLKYINSCLMVSMCEQKHVGLLCL